MLMRDFLGQKEFIGLKNVKFEILAFVSGCGSIFWKNIKLFELHIILSEIKVAIQKAH